MCERCHAIAPLLVLMGISHFYHRTRLACIMRRNAFLSVCEQIIETHDQISAFVLAPHPLQVSSFVAHALADQIITTSTTCWNNVVKTPVELIMITWPPHPSASRHRTARPCFLKPRSRSTQRMLCPCLLARKQRGTQRTLCPCFLERNQRGEQRMQRRQRARARRRGEADRSAGAHRVLLQGVSLRQNWRPLSCTHRGTWL